MPVTTADPASPDDHATMLTDQSLDALRYDGHTVIDPGEVSGIMNAWMPERARVLDVGSGPGSMTVLINHGRNNDILCIEPDRERASAAESRGLAVHCGILDEEFLSGSGKFDVVTMADVLEHSANPGEMLKKAFEALQPGGYVIASVPNVAHWSVRLSLLAGRFDYTATGIMDVTHLRWFTKKTYQELFDRSGFEVESMAQSAGLFLPQYNTGIFRLVPGRWTRKFIRLATLVWPGLFGCQHIVKARRPI